MKVGERFGRLTVIQGAVKGYIECRCDCGTVKRFYGANVKFGRSKSCGCLNREMIGQRARTHGKSRTKEHKAWLAMWNRCTNPVVDRFPRYGGRGISVCDRWLTFEGFFADMGLAPTPRHSLDRIDVDGNYEPGNCRWATPLEQANNTSANVYVEYQGKRQSVSDWARETGIPVATLTQRVRAGMPLERMFHSGNLTPRPITVDGVTRLTTEWMDVACIPISSFYLFRRKGLTEQEIVRKYLSKKVRRLEKRQ